MFLSRFLFGIFLVSSVDLSAQCSMCKAVVASSGGGEGLNTGILYLMVIPYLLVFGIGFFIWRHKKKRQRISE